MDIDQRYSVAAAIHCRAPQLPSALWILYDHHGLCPAAPDRHMLIPVAVRARYPFAIVCA